MRRTVASIPFACRYRFIDFTLSNMVNSDIYNISVITHYNYQFLIYLPCVRRQPMRRHR